MDPWGRQSEQAPWVWAGDGDSVRVLCVAERPERDGRPSHTGECTCQNSKSQRTFGFIHLPGSKFYLKKNCKHMWSSSDCRD